MFLLLKQITRMNKKVSGGESSLWNIRENNKIEYSQNWKNSKKSDDTINNNTFDFSEILKSFHRTLLEKSLQLECSGFYFWARLVKKILWFFRSKKLLWFFENSEAQSIEAITTTSYLNNHQEVQEVVSSTVFIVGRTLFKTTQIPLPFGLNSCETRFFCFSRLPFIGCYKLIFNERKQREESSKREDIKQRTRMEIRRAGWSGA